MKVALDQRAHLGNDDAVDRAMQRYKAAFAEYEDLSDKNKEVTLSGGKCSPQARLEEDRALDELDSARHALFTAAAVAFPTVH